MSSIQKEITLKQIGWQISGVANINLWGGGSGEIDMKSSFIRLRELTYSKFLSCINDGGFGCESINDAEVCVEEVYSNGNGRDTYLHFIKWITVIMNKDRNKLANRGI